MLPLWLRYPAHKFCPAAPKIPALTGYLTFGGGGDGPRGYSIGELIPTPPKNYPMVRTGGDEGIDGGIFQAGINEARILTVYVEVDDVQATIDKAKRLGAKSAGPPITVPGIGSFAHISDSDGQTIGVMQETEIQDGLG